MGGASFAPAALHSRIVETMATFGELRDQLRDSKLVEDGTDFYAQEELLRFLTKASHEIAAALRFPRLYESIAMANNASFITLPNLAIDVESVTFDGMRIARVALPHVRFYQGMPISAFPRGWYFDPLRGGADIQIGPPTRAGTYEVEYVRTLQDPPSVNDTPWYGLFPEFHELVSLRAAVTAFEKSMEAESSAYYIQRYQGMLQEFGSFLGRSVPRGLMARDTA